MGAWEASRQDSSTVYWIGRNHRSQRVHYLSGSRGVGRDWLAGPGSRGLPQPGYAPARAGTVLPRARPLQASSQLPLPWAKTIWPRAGTGSTRKLCVEHAEVDRRFAVHPDGRLPSFFGGRAGYRVD